MADRAKQNQLVVAFTGTRRGMSPKQYESLRLLLLTEPKWKEFHHGAARGADTQASLLVQHLCPYVWVVPHPAGADPLQRNRDMVALCDLLVAAPYEASEILRSGTWATVRYARKAGLPVHMLPR